MKLYALLLLSILAVFTSCNGQNPVKESHSSIAVGDAVTTTDDSIMVVYQDKANNYWFGSTTRGVYRYDGKTLIQFTTKHGLSHNRIWEIKEDKAGNIYINTSDGINKYDGKTFTTLKVAKAVAEWKLEPDDLWFIDIKNDYMPLRYDGKLLYSLEFPKNDKEDLYRKMFPSVPFSPYSIYTIYNDSKGRVWFGTGALGVGCYDGKAFTWINEDDLTEIHNGPSNGLRSVAEDKNGTFWFSTYYRYIITQKPEGGIIYERKKGIEFPQSYSIDGIEYLSATVDNNGDLWMVTFRDGVWRYDGKNVTHYDIKDGDKNVLQFSIYKDKQGSLWLGTHTAGVYKFNGKEFEKFKP
jgi:ligand-binding sensor domain-containing protein